MKNYTKDYNSSKNQAIKGELVKQHIITNLNLTIRELDELSDGHYGELYDYMSNYVPTDEDGKEDSDNGEYPAIYEFWAVSGYLADKLEEKGECIAKDFLDFNIWGRCTTGQAILLDYVISQIAEDMEILEGQANEWNIK